MAPQYFSVTSRRVVASEGAAQTLACCHHTCSHVAAGMRFVVPSVRRVVDLKRGSRPRRVTHIISLHTGRRNLGLSSPLYSTVGH